MDKQTAVDLLDNLLGMIEDNHESDYDTAIKMGIDALKMQLSVESTTFPVDGEPLDCISRQQAILCIERNAYRREDINETEHIIKWVLDIIKWLPSEQPERATGKWIDADLDKDFWTCSECKKSGCRDRTAWRPDYVKTHFRFCPNCGAQMERRDG